MTKLKSDFAIAAFYRTLGYYLRDARKRNGISLESCALELGISPEQMENIEFGKTRIYAHQIRQIAEYIGISMASFFETGQECIPCGLFNHQYTNEILVTMGEAINNIHTELAKLNNK